MTSLSITLVKMPFRPASLESSNLLPRTSVMLSFVPCLGQGRPPTPAVVVVYHGMAAASLDRKARRTLIACLVIRTEALNMASLPRFSF